MTAGRYALAVIYGVVCSVGLSWSAAGTWTTIIASVFSNYCSNAVRRPARP
jgi:hypothetical protein